MSYAWSVSSHAPLRVDAYEASLQNEPRSVASLSPMRTESIVVALVLAAPTAAPAQLGLAQSAVAPSRVSLDGPVAVAEREVKTLPLLERPNRLGHFYGNTVRRLHHGRLCVNCGAYDRPLARYLYRP